MNFTSGKYPFISLLHTVGREAFRVLDCHLSGYNITHQQARVIWLIHGLSKRGEKVCQKDIERATRVSGPSVTSLIQGLERKGYVSRSTSLTDDRVKELVLTEEGRKLIDIIEHVFDCAEKKDQRRAQ